MASIDEEKGEAGIAETHLPAGLAHDLSQVPASPTTQTVRSSRSGSSATLLERSDNGLRSYFPKLRQLFSRGSSKSSSASEGSEDDDECDFRKLNEAPNGYPRMATFLDSDENFMLYRRFGYIQSRLLIEKQDDLRRLELKLDVMDTDDVTTGNENLLQSRSDYGEDFMKERQALMAQIETKWLEYSKLLLAGSQMAALNKPTNIEHASVKNWMSIERPLIGDDAGFIAEKEDLVTLRPGREYAWLDAAVEKLLRNLHLPGLENLFRSTTTRRKMAASKGITYYTRARIAHLVNTIMLAMILLLLIVPVAILFHVTDNANDSPNTEGICVGVLLISTLAFSAGVALFSRARRHEVLAASAGYCAILVVFIGNIGGRGISGAFKAPS